MNAENADAPVTDPAVVPKIHRKTGLSAFIGG
jgi:hypothetical protein